MLLALQYILIFVMFVKTKQILLLDINATVLQANNSTKMEFATTVTSSDANNVHNPQSTFVALV